MWPNALFSIGDYGVHLYGVMIGVGILLCFLVLFKYTKRGNIDPKFVDFVFYNGIVAIVGGFASASLFQSFYNYLENPSAGFKLGGGVTFIGGLIGGAVIFLLIYAIFRNKYKNKLIDIISMTPCCILIAHAFGRIGCFCAGCCYGAEATGFWSFLGVKFPGMSVAVHPTMLYEAAFLFIMFAICSVLYLRKNCQHNMTIYLITYGVFRFLIEFVRDDHRGELVPGLSPSQFWALCMIVLGVIVYFMMNALLVRRHRQLAAEGGDVIESVPAVETEGVSLAEATPVEPMANASAKIIEFNAKIDTIIATDANAATLDSIKSSILTRLQKSGINLADKTVLESCVAKLDKAIADRK